MTICANWVNCGNPKSKTNYNEFSISIFSCFGFFRNQPTFYKILNGETKGMYGWKLLDKEIRSEAEGGKGPSERSETST